MWRCVNALFAYCKESPNGANKARIENRMVNIEGKDSVMEINMGAGATCTLDPKTCKNHVLFSQLVAKNLAPEATIRTTILLDNEVKTDKGKQKQVI